MYALMTIILFTLLNPASSDNENQFEKAMKEALNNLNQAESAEEFQLTANQFDRIGKISGDNWFPFYHAAYAKVMMAAMEPDVSKKDPFLDAAQQDLDKIEHMDHDTVERLALQGFLHMISMSVDASRGMTLGQECAMVLNQAYSINKQNPRAVLMLAQFKHGSASYLGADTSEACSMFEDALALFDREEDEGSIDFYPTWGKEIALMMKQGCDQ